MLVSVSLRKNSNAARNGRSNGLSATELAGILLQYCITPSQGRTNVKRICVHQVLRKKRTHIHRTRRFEALVRPTEDTTGLFHTTQIAFACGDGRMDTTSRSNSLPSEAHQNPLSPSVRNGHMTSSASASPSRSRGNQFTNLSFGDGLGNATFCPCCTTTHLLLPISGRDWTLVPDRSQSGACVGRLRSSLCCSPLVRITWYQSRRYPCSFVHDGTTVIAKEMAEVLNTILRP